MQVCGIWHPSEVVFFTFKVLVTGNPHAVTQYLNSSGCKQFAGVVWYLHDISK